MERAADPDKKELLRRIGDSRRRLDDLISPLSDPEMTEPGSAGWSIKDHLAHLAAWEESLLALLEGRDREAAMGITHETEAGGDHDVDWINEQVTARSRATSLPQVLDEYRSAHARVLSALERLTNADLSRSYASFQPGTDDSAPVIGWIDGDTWKHFDEHYLWITALLDEVGPTI